MDQYTETPLLWSNYIESCLPILFGVGVQILNMKRHMKTKDKIASQHNASRLFITLKKTIPHNNFLQYSMIDNPKHAHSPKLAIAAGQVSVS